MYLTMNFLLCYRQSDAYVKHCFYLVMTQLEKDHSEIRLSSLLIIDEIFNRSHCFRDLLLKDFQNFLELTLGMFYATVNCFTQKHVELDTPKIKKTCKTIKLWRTYLVTLFICLVAW